MTVHPMVAALRAQLAKHGDPENPEPTKAVYDESPTLAREDVIHLAEIEQLSRLLNIEGDLQRSGADTELAYRAFIVLVIVYLPLLYWLDHEGTDAQPREWLDAALDHLAARGVWLDAPARAEQVVCQTRGAKGWVADEERLAKLQEIGAAHGGTVLARLIALMSLGIDEWTTGLSALTPQHRETRGVIQADEPRFDKLLWLVGLIPRIRAALSAPALWWTEDGTGVAFVRPTAEATAIAADGGVILDATPNIALIRERFPDAKIVRLSVRDSATSTRCILYRSNATRARLDWESLARFLLAALAKMPLAKRVLVVTYKDRADALSNRKAPREVRELIELWLRAEPGREIDYAYYGNVRGLDRWMTFDGFITIGDPRPNIESAGRVAANYNLNADEHITHEARAELAQAHGRARDPGRRTPAYHVHVGALPPIGWNLTNVTVERTFSGCPRTSSSMTAEELREIVDAVGGWTRAAEICGLNRTTLQRWAKGIGAPSEQAATALRAARDLPAVAAGRPDNGIVSGREAISPPARRDVTLLLAGVNADSSPASESLTADDEMPECPPPAEGTARPSASLKARFASARLLLASRPEQPRIAELGHN
ncbi:MAG: hypothetical protein WCJ30_06515 [Deltaproteobacteria bacterium]